MESHCCHHGLLIQIHGGASVRVCIHQKWLKYVLIKEVWLFVSPLYLPFSPPIIFFPISCPQTLKQSPGCCCCTGRVKHVVTGTWHTLLGLLHEIKPKWWWVIWHIPAQPSLAVPVIQRLENTVTVCLDYGLDKYTFQHIYLYSFASRFDQRSCQWFSLNVYYFIMHLFILPLKIGRRMNKYFMS